MRTLTANISTSLTSLRRRIFSYRTYFSIKEIFSVWQGKLSWRISLSIFICLLLTQSAGLFMAMQNEKATELERLRLRTEVAILPHLAQKSSENPETFIDESVAQAILKSGRADSLTIYDRNFEKQTQFGNPTTPDASTRNIYRHNGYYDSKAKTYHFFLNTAHLDTPFFIQVQIPANHIERRVWTIMFKRLIVMSVVTGIMTLLLMTLIGQWLLKPVLFLRENLLAASKNPESPTVNESPYSSRDEIGEAVNIAMDLVFQNARNISQVKDSAESQIHKLAYYDTLTGLPNRTYFIQRMNSRIHMLEKLEPCRFAIVTMDLDHFKDINDTVGHSVGDALLRTVGKRLEDELPQGAFVARTGEDEFAIAMQLNNTQVSDAMEIAEQVAAIVKNEPYRIFNEDFQIRGSIGVATYPDNGRDVDRVLKSADIALNRAKEDGRDRIKEYTKEFDESIQKRFEILRNLRKALETDELVVYFQPQLDLNSEQVISAETLIRWWKKDDSEEGGHFISPGDFIPIAEQSGLIVPIGERVLRDAVHKAAEWHAAGYDHLRVAVNVSGAQFYEGNLVRLVKEVLKETGLPPHKLELEVTESIFMDDINYTISVLRELHDVGVELAIDDFGTGYSSLAYLRQFPIDRLKIDQSFVRNVLENPDDGTITKTIINLGHSLSLKVIAEGVETIPQQEFLRENGCDEVQGFLYSKAIPQEDFMAFLKNYSGKLPKD